MEKMHYAGYRYEREKYRERKRKVEKTNGREKTFLLR